jgi:hypothetical protein
MRVGVTLPSFLLGGEDMLTAKEIFITTMNLMDELSEDGTYDGYPSEYKTKSWSILTMLQAELTPSSSTPTMITNQDSYLSVDDRTALTVLPNGLAAHLLMNEDQNRASFFNARYDELKRKRPAKAVKITDKYGIIPQETTDEESIDGGDFLFDYPTSIDGGEF